jgi:hypothetical protein
LATVQRITNSPTSQIWGGKKKKKKKNPKAKVVGYSKILQKRQISTQKQ